MERKWEGNAYMRVRIYDCVYFFMRTWMYIYGCMYMYRFITMETTEMTLRSVDWTPKSHVDQGNAAYGGEPIRSTIMSTTMTRQHN